ncbi:MAG: hypothetical protein HKM05_11740 [Spirochaetales bacterium]|nr:hypothetical protein [Spirochaetales bacterium]
MRRLRSLAVLTAVLLAGNSTLSAALPDFSTLTGSISTLADKAGAALPSASALGLDWSDSWIGSLVGVPPHFGLGLSAGFTTIPTGSLQPIFDAMGQQLPSYATALGGVPLPMYTINGRIGGFLLPFDIGLKLGYMPTLTVSNMGVDYLLAGADLRYALLQDGITPGLSVGFGVNYIQADVSYTFPNQTFNVPGFTTGTGDVTLTAPTASLGLKDLSYELKAEISKNLLIVTPYAGAAIDLSEMRAEAAFNGTITSSAGSLTPSDISQLNSLTGANFTNNGVSYTALSNNIWGARIYGGFSFNIVFFKIDVKALYSFPSGNLGADVGARFQM